MKLSPRTINVLKNFSSINPNLLVKEGNELKTISPQHNIMASAEITESFPREFGIYDLGQFLGAMSLLDEPDLEFGEKFVELTGKNKQTIRYFYCDPSLITHPGSKQIKALPSVDVEFALRSNQLTEVLKAASVLQLPEVIVQSTSNGIELTAIDSKNKSSNHSSAIVSGANNGAKFKMIFKAENLKMIPQDYTVQICSKGISRFESKEGGSLVYYVATEAHSEYKA